MMFSCVACDCRIGCEPTLHVVPRTDRETYCGERYSARRYSARRYSARRYSAERYRTQKYSTEGSQSPRATEPTGQSGMKPERRHPTEATAANTASDPLIAGASDGSIVTSIGGVSTARRMPKLRMVKS